MLHPGRVVETSESQPCVVGVVVVVIVVSVSSRVLHSVGRAHVAWGSDDSFRYEPSHHTTR